MIAAKLPAFKASFAEFTDQIFSEDPAKTYYWQENAPWAVGAESLPWAERFGSHVELCLGSRDISQVLLTQTIMRAVDQTSSKTSIDFYYDVGPFYFLPELDRSFLLVHEWLWNFTDDITVNREADYLLHSTWIESTSSKDAINKFKEIGIQYP